MDLISREAVGNLEKSDTKGSDYDRGWNDALYAVDSLPSAFEGMTCGEIIEALFQTEGIYKDDDFVEFVFKGETHTSYFTRDFWDSPYKGVSE